MEQEKKIDNVLILQARMSSSRLPGKVLREVNGIPVLGYILKRLSYCEEVSQIWVATSAEEEDDSIELYCTEVDVPCFRGSLLDVAGRFVELLENIACSRFVRLCADSPWCDPKLIDEAILLHRSKQVTIVTNVAPRTFPPGISVEVLERESFLKAYPAFSPYEREHVTQYFYQSSSSFSIFNIDSYQKTDRSMSLAIDTEYDIQNFADVISRMSTTWIEQAGWREVLAEYQKLSS